MSCGQGLPATAPTERMESSPTRRCPSVSHEADRTRNGSRDRGITLFFDSIPSSDTTHRPTPSIPEFGVIRSKVLSCSGRRKTLVVPDIREVPAGEPSRALIPCESLPRCTGSLRDDSRSEHQEGESPDDRSRPGKDQHRPSHVTSREQQNDTYHYQRGVRGVRHSQPKQQTAVCLHRSIVRRAAERLPTQCRRADYIVRAATAERAVPG